jgi:transmembrane sensor
MSNATTRLLLAAAAITTLSGSQFVGDTINIGYVVTQVGEMRSLNLSDGSEVTLNTDSVIKTRADGASLNVEVLRGEVLFAMKHNSMRRLVVTAGHLDITDTSTVFDVRLTVDGQAWVIVKEGEVRLSDGRLGQVPLMHNQQAVSDHGAGLLEVHSGLSSAAIERELSWRAGRVSFLCERLSDAAREFNRYNLTKLEVDPRIAEEQIGGEFSATDVAGFVQLMPRLDSDIRWERVRNAQGATVLRLYLGANASHTARQAAPCNPL